MIEATLSTSNGIAARYWQRRLSGCVIRNGIMVVTPVTEIQVGDLIVSGTKSPTFGQAMKNGEILALHPVLSVRKGL